MLSLSNLDALFLFFFYFFKSNPHTFTLFDLPINLQFFTTEPYACDPSSLPKYPPTKEMDAKRRDDETRRYLFSQFA